MSGRNIDEDIPACLFGTQEAMLTANTIHSFGSHGCGNFLFLAEDREAFFKKLIYFYLFIFSCIGSLLLRASFLWLQQAGAPLSWVPVLLIAVASLVVEHGL